MKKAFDEGWGGVICKTLSLDAKKVINVTPRYAKLRDASGAVFGWENIELISDRLGGRGWGRGEGGGGSGELDFTGAGR
jgi:dihydroorotate dehydrogenase